MEAINFGPLLREEEANNMQKATAPRERGVPAPAPRARGLTFFWLRDNEKITVRFISNDYEGFWCHWVPNGPKMRTTCCTKPKCIWCKEYGLIADQWTGYALCHIERREGIFALMITPHGADELKPHLSRGLRGCVFDFWKDRHEKGQPQRAKFLRRGDGDDLPEPFDFFDPLCRIWRVDPIVARRTLRPEEANRRPSWEEMSNQVGE